MNHSTDYEAELQAKGLTAPRVTLADIESKIVGEYFFTAYDGAKYQRITRDEPADVLKRLTFCVLVLKNGFTVTGESACVVAANFDAEIGKKIARQKAIDKVWQLEGYLLAENLRLAARGRAIMDCAARLRQDEQTIAVMNQLSELR